MNSFKGKLDYTIPLPSLLAYPSHHVEVVPNQTFSIFYEGKAQRCGCTKADALRLKKDWWYTIKNKINKSLE